MKTYRVTLVYTTYVHYEVQADSEDQATDMAWSKIEHNPPDLTYGDWETVDVEFLP